jgi:hypothetical protein
VWKMASTSRITNKNVGQIKDSIIIRLIEGDSNKL